MGKMATTMKLILIFGLISFIWCFIEPSCNRDVSWLIHNCPGYNELGSVLTLNASSPLKNSIPCIAIPKHTMEKPAKLYIMKMKFKNIQGWKGINSAHIGFIFNVQDINNYDLVYARLHSPTIQYGYVENGVTKFISNLNLLGDRSGSVSHSFQIDVEKDKTVS